MNIPSPISISPEDLNIWLLSDRNKPVIVDVREKDELILASFPYDFIHIPLSEFTGSLSDLNPGLLMNKKIVVLCHSGVRSYNFGCWLLAKNLVKEIWNLEEGIDGWSKYVDPRIPRY
tara:strand:+ start:7489 stop:7842 length:354 start_codon:yes stop_codon:yes gene_type:complete